MITAVGFVALVRFDGAMLTSLMGAANLLLDRAAAAVPLLKASIQ